MSFSQFIKNLQRAPEPVKKRWLFGSSAVAIVLVITLWIFYLNMTLPRTVAKGDAEITPPTGENAEEGDSIFDTFSKGFSQISKDIKTQWNSFSQETKSTLNELKRSVETENEFTVTSGTSTASTTPQEVPHSEFPQP